MNKYQACYRKGYNNGERKILRIVIFLILIILIIVGIKYLKYDNKNIDSVIIDKEKSNFSLRGIFDGLDDLGSCAKFPMSELGSNTLICNKVGELEYRNQGNSYLDVMVERETFQLERLAFSLECVLRCDKEDTTSKLECKGGIPMVICK